MLQDYLEDVALNSLPHALAKLKEDPVVVEPVAKMLSEKSANSKRSPHS